MITQLIPSFSLLVDKADTNFSVENFTFFKEPIGMDSTQEILRYAKTRRVCNDYNIFMVKQLLVLTS